MTYPELKGIVYIFQTVLGIFLIALAWKISAVDEISLKIAAGIALVSGLLCLLFGVVTYILRDDPDIWR